VRERTGLDQPLLVQFAAISGPHVSGRYGPLGKKRAAGAGEIANRLPNTLLLASNQPGAIRRHWHPDWGIFGHQPNSWFDGGSMTFALLGVSMPIFWLGLMLMILFAVLLPRWLGCRAAAAAHRQRHLAAPGDAGHRPGGQLDGHPGAHDPRLHARSAAARLRAHRPRQRAEGER
jgi:ABC-type dipeptide/oligopeptide/nickel transport system permease component